MQERIFRIKFCAGFTQAAKAGAKQQTGAANSGRPLLWRVEFCFGNQGDFGALTYLAEAASARSRLDIQGSEAQEHPRHAELFEFACGTTSDREVDRTAH